MRLVRLGVASLDATVGAVRSNADRVIRAAREMAEADVTIAVFPEQTVGGYAPEDLVQWRRFVAAQREELERIARATAELPLSLAVGLVVQVDGQLFNCGAMLHAGRILGFVPKERLPAYNVFYEMRTLSRGSPGLGLEVGGVPLGDLLFRFDFGTVAVEVCEDVWTPDGPMRRRCLAGAEVVLNLSASPYRVGVLETRREMLATRSGDNQTTLAYANRVGGQDGLVYDGGGFVLQNGRPCLDAPRFREGWWSCAVDLDRTARLRIENTTWREDLEAAQRQGLRIPVVHSEAPTGDRESLPYPAPPGGNFFLPGEEPPPPPRREAVLDDLFEALALGVRSYFEKPGGFRRIGVALSGGRDSVLTLLVAWRARERVREESGDGRDPLVHAFYMPSRLSVPATREAAVTLCRELEIPLTESSIDEAYEREVEATREMLGCEPDAITRQNVQARVRAARMWNWANTARGLFLQTGDMSEKAVGYTTIGGDLEGGLSVIANLPKTVVVAMLDRLHARFGLAGIRLCLQTTPGPELAEDQAAEEELMPFSVLDACLYLYAGEKLSPSEVARALASLFPDRPPAELARHAERFAELFTRSVYKWVQAPLTLHVGTLDLERERALQLPVVQRTEWS